MNPERPKHSLTAHTIPIVEGRGWVCSQHVGTGFGHYSGFYVTIQQYESGERINSRQIANTKTLRERFDLRTDVVFTITETDGEKLADQLGKAVNTNAGIGRERLGVTEQPVDVEGAKKDEQNLIDLFGEDEVKIPGMDWKGYPDLLGREKEVVLGMDKEKAADQLQKAKKAGEGFERYWKETAHGHRKTKGRERVARQSEQGEGTVGNEWMRAADDLGTLKKVRRKDAEEDAGKRVGETPDTPGRLNWRKVADELADIKKSEGEHAKPIKNKDDESRDPGGKFMDGIMDEVCKRDVEIMERHQRNKKDAKRVERGMGK